MDNNKNGKFKPTTMWMAENYAKLNDELFGGELGECILRPFTTGKGSQGGTLGWFKITAKNIRIECRGRRMFASTGWGNKEYVNYDNFYDLCQPCIELNANYSWSEHAMLATLAHEMCHYYTYMRGIAPKQGHGHEFYAIGETVSNRSNGLFTIQRLASAEQMSEMELDPEMQAKKDKRLANKKSKVSAIFVYNKVGTAELTMTSSPSVIQTIVDSSTKSPRFHEAERGLAWMIIKINDADFIETLFANGFKKNFRTYRYWDGGKLPKIQALSAQALKVDHEVLYDSSDGNTPKVQQDEPKPVEKRPIRYFVLKLSNGGEFRCKGENLSSLIKCIKARFPKMSDDNIQKLINNPANYQMIDESKKTISQIIKEAVNTFLNNEFGNKNDDSIAIDPNMNLGLESPFEAAEEI